MLIAGQLFWIGRVVDLGERFSPGKPRRALLTAIASVVCLFFFAYNIAPYISPWEIPRGDSTHLTLRHVLFEAPFWCWFVGSWLGFALVMVFWPLDRAGRVHEPGPLPRTPSDSVRQRLLRERRQPAVRQPRHRNHRPPIRLGARPEITVVELTRRV